jgi:hypothetical protein
MAGNAVASSAKTRKVDEKPFLKNRRQRIIEIGGFGESKQFLR